MKKTLIAFASAAVVSSLSAGPVIDILRSEQPAGSPSLVIDYVLSEEAALVTLDVQTNGVSIGRELVVNATGDVNRKVEPGTRQVKWNARKAWPDHLVSDGSVTARLTAWALNCPPPYMVLSLDGQTPPAFYESADLVPGGVSNDLYKTDKILMKKIPAAFVRWRMGSTADETAHGTDWTDREIAHEVVLTEDYYMGVYEVTRGQFKAATGQPGGTNFGNSRKLPAGGRPYRYVRGAVAEGIDWPTTGTNVANNCDIDCFRRLTLMDTIDLPTEAQWEFACRAGTGSGIYTGKELPQSIWSDGQAANLEPIAWFSGNSAVVTDETTNAREQQTHEVGGKEPNAFGLYDMCGNAFEWCLDWASEGSAYSGGTPVIDPKGTTAQATAQTSPLRVVRGGCFNQNGAVCRSACRGFASVENAWSIEYGFRLCCPACIK